MAGTPDKVFSEMLGHCRQLSQASSHLRILKLSPMVFMMLTMLFLSPLPISAGEGQPHPDVILKLNSAITKIYEGDTHAASTAIFESGITEPKEGREKKIEALSKYLTNVYQTLLIFNGEKKVADKAIPANFVTTEFVKDDGKLLIGIFSAPHEQQQVYWSFTLFVDHQHDPVIYRMKTINAGDTALELLRELRSKP